MKREILTMLRENGEYVSGQQICETLGVSRTAVWKAINGLKAEGYEIEALQNRGYCLVSAPDVLTEAEVGSRRCDLWKDSPLVVYDETDSTNIQAARLANQGAPEGTLVIADAQTSGKGRRGRHWATPHGISLAMSFVLRPKFCPEKASMLTLIAAYACREAVSELTGLEPLIKWPNDIVLNRKKITGILTEMSMEEDYISRIIVGIGFNVGQDHFDGELKDKATSLYMETGKHYSRAALACLVMKYFAVEYRKFCEIGDLSFLCDRYNDKLVSRGREVKILSPGAEWNGTSLGINSEGALLVRDSSGKTQEIIGGEVSVRGIYGYV